MSALSTKDRVCASCDRSLVGCRRVETRENGTAVYARECTGAGVARSGSERRCWLPWLGDAKPVFAGVGGEAMWLALVELSGARDGSFANPGDREELATLQHNALYAIARQLQEYEIGENNARAAFFERWKQAGRMPKVTVASAASWPAGTPVHVDTSLLKTLAEEFFVLPVDTQLAVSAPFSPALLPRLLARMKTLACAHCGGSGCEPNHTGENAFDGDPCTVCRSETDEA